LQQSALNVILETIMSLHQTALWPRIPNYASNCINGDWGGYIQWRN